MTATARPVSWSPPVNGPLMARETGNRSGKDEAQVQDVFLTWAFGLERVTGIEPALSAWEADVLPLNYTRTDLQRRVA